MTEKKSRLLQNISIEANRLQKNAKEIEDLALLKHIFKTLKTENIFTENNTASMYINCKISVSTKRQDWTGKRKN